LDKGLIKKIVIYLYKIALKRSSCVFFQNTYGLELFDSLKILRSKYRMVPGSGVNLQNFPYSEYKDEKDGIIFNFIGRVMRDKGIEEYLKAAEYIKNKYPETEFRIIGLIEESEIRYKGLIKEYENKGIVNKGISLSNTSIILRRNGKCNT
jgi:glycosyltransferase involved in cell wall biosynthesis